MIALIDTIFSPVMNWLSQIISYLHSATIPKSYSLELGSLFAPLNMISPSWTLLITNIFIMFVTYSIVYISVNGTGLYLQFKEAIKWW